MAHISGSELEALASLERMYSLFLELAKRAGLDGADLADITVEHTGRYSSGTWTIERMLDSADAVLERAKHRKVGSKSRRPWPQKYIADVADWTTEDHLVAYKNASKREQARLIREAQDEEESAARKRAEEVL